MNLRTIYTDETKAREHLEAIRWPNGPVCPHCGFVTAITPVAAFKGKSTAPVSEVQRLP